MKIWLSRATKVMIICLAVLWNGQLLAETDEGLSKEYSNCIDRAEKGTTADASGCSLTMTAARAKELEGMLEGL